MDLHAWITQQVDHAERVATAARDDIHTVLPMAYLGDENPIAQDLVSLMNPFSIQRRCEADRRILARHNVDPTAGDSPTFATACDGCRSEWVQDDCEPFVENINDCPELLDLAHAHGITDETLARLDRPKPPEPDGDLPADAGYEMRITHWPTPPITTSDVPAALRGHRWKP